MKKMIFEIIKDILVKSKSIKGKLFCIMLKVDGQKVNLTYSKHSHTLDRYLFRY